MGKHKICMIVQQRDVRGGIAAVVDGYYKSRLEKDYDITYVESYRNGTKLQKLLKALKAYGTFRRLLKISPPDLVHMHSSFGPSFYRQIPFIRMASQKGIPVVNHIHGADFASFYSHAPEGKKKRIRRVYNQCACLIALSDEWRDRLRQIVPREKIRVISNYGVPRSSREVQSWQAQREKAGQVLFLGEIGRRKGGYDLPAIIEKTCDQVPSAHFVIAGDGEAKEVESMIPESLRSKVRFPGWVRGKDKEKLLEESCIFLLPSYQEGMPMSILDAMAYGLPVVSTLVGGIPKIVEEGKSGFLLQPGDTEGIAGALAKLLKDPALCAAMGDEGRSIVEERYSLTRHLDRLEAVYEEVLT